MNKFEINDMRGYSLPVEKPAVKEITKKGYPKQALSPESKWHLRDRKDGIVFLLNKIFFG